MLGFNAVGRLLMGRTDEEVEAGEEGPGGTPRLRLLELVLLLKGIDSVFTLATGLPGISHRVLPGVHGVSHIFPVLLPEIATV